VNNRNLALVIGLIALVIVMRAVQRDRQAPDQEDAPAPPAVDRTTQRIDEALAPRDTVPPREGLAAAIVIDVSGSMAEKVEGRTGREARKIEIAREAALDLVDQFTRYADEHKEEPVQLGIYEFSRRRGEEDCRAVVPMGAPNREEAAKAIARLRADGGTPIGQAMITAKQALDATGLSRRHLLVVTDGENTDGFAPDRVAAVIGKRPDSERPSIYFVAFDVDAKLFNGVRDAGGLVLPAANAKELNDTLDTLLRGKILVEK
jgi:Mg-chelatase subunit ChlD